MEFLPKRVILAGHFDLTPNGNHGYVLTNPDATSQHPVTLRCDLASSGCANYTPDKKNPQIDPAGAISGGEYVGKDALEDDVKARLKERAIADGKFFDGVCPTDTSSPARWSGCRAVPWPVHEEQHLELAGESRGS